MCVEKQKVDKNAYWSIFSCFNVIFYKPYFGGKNTAKFKNLISNLYDILYFAF